MLFKEISFQTEKQKSKFIAFSFHFKNKGQLSAILTKLKRKHTGAAHICYAYKCFENADFDTFLTPMTSFGVLKSYFDDGEPSGTAGQPILQSIENSGINNVLVVVVRYFGGTKLGTAGLFKAYAEAAQGVLEDNYVILTLCDGFILRCTYSGYNALQKYAEQHELRVDDAEFLTEVQLCLFIEKEKSTEHLKNIKDTITTKLEFVGERYI